MSDLGFREILGVSADASREEIRKAYRQRVMENHPDRFPPDRKALQEMATIALTEAYTALMSRAAEKVATAGWADPIASAANPPRAAWASTAAGFSTAAPASGAGAPAAAWASAAPLGAGIQPAAGSLALPRDPAYAYYKQGFINFSLAIHGIAAVNRRIAAGRVMPSRRRFNTREYFGASLAYLRAAHGYFNRVVNDYASSVWTADARFKLRRIEGLTAIYRRILGNLRSR